MEIQYDKLAKEWKNTLEMIPMTPPENLSYTQKYSYAELVHYLKGIRKQDVNAIPKTLLDYLKRSSEGIKCTFDYWLPLKELNLSSYTKDLITMIAGTYWCETDDQFRMAIDKKYLDEINFYESLIEEEDE